MCGVQVVFFFGWRWGVGKLFSLSSSFFGLIAV